MSATTERTLEECGACIEYVPAKQQEEYSSCSGRYARVSFGKGHYSINVKRSVWTALGALLDVLALQGIASAALAAMGVTAQALTKLSEEEGEVCIARVLATRKEGLRSHELLTVLQRADPFNRLRCRYKTKETRVEVGTMIFDRCAIELEALELALDNLKSQGVVTRDGEGRWRMEL